VINVALLGIIRRWYIRDHSSIREIARRLDISRNTVRRYIRSDAIEPAYPARHSPSSLDEFAPRLSAWLSAESVKSRKQRRTLKQMFLDLKELGYQGSYDRVAAFGRRWKVGQMERVKSASKSTVHNMKTLKRTYTIKQSAKRAAALHQAKIKEVREIISENKQDSSRIKMRKTPAGVFL